MRTSLNLHGITVKEFVRLMAAMVDVQEWENTEIDPLKPFYMSGQLMIGETQIDIFTVNYPSQMGKVKLVKSSESE